MPIALEILERFGFPIFVCLWFMWRMESRITNLGERLDKLILLVTVIKRIDDHTEKGPE